MNYRDEWKKKTAENPWWMYEWVWDHYFRLGGGMKAFHTSRGGIQRDGVGLDLVDGKTGILVRKFRKRVRTTHYRQHGILHIFACMSPHRYGAYRRATRFSASRCCGSLQETPKLMRMKLSVISPHLRGNSPSNSLQVVT